jgi:hypothetical protein
MNPSELESKCGQDNKRDRRPLRIVGALLLGLLVLAATLPSTGGMIAGHSPDPRMWRCGPFLFYPTAFFPVIGIVTLAVACTIFGIKRRNSFEVVGWALLGLLLFLLAMA